MAYTYHKDSCSCRLCQSDFEFFIVRRSSKRQLSSRSVMSRSYRQWAYDKELYKRRNEIERFFRRLKRFRRIFTRYDKLDVLFAGVILFAMIVDSLVWTWSNSRSLVPTLGTQRKSRRKILVDRKKNWLYNSKLLIDNMMEKLCASCPLATLGYAAHLFLIRN